MNLGNLYAARTAMETGCDDQAVRWDNESVRMDGAMTFFSSRVYFRLVTFGLLISTLPVIFVGLFSWFSASRIIQRKVDEGNAQILQQTVTQVEQSLRQVENAALQLLLYKNGVMLGSSYRYGDLSATEDYVEILDTIGQLNSLSTESLQVEDAAFVSTGGNDVISTRGYFELDALAERELFMECAASPDFSRWVVWNDFLVQEATSPDSTPNAGVALVKRLMPLRTFRTDAFLIVKISGDEFTKYIGGSRFGRIMILDGSGRVIADPDRSLLGRDYSANAAVARILETEEDSGLFPEKTDAGTVQISYVRSEYNGWLYVSSTPLTAVTRESRLIGFATLLTCIVLVVMVVLVSHFGSRRMYSSIGRFYDAVIGEIGQEGVCGKDEMAVLDEKIRVLLHERRQMHRQLQTQLGQSRDFFITKLLEGEIGSEGMREKLLSFGYALDWKQMCVMVLEVDTLDGSAFGAEETDLLLFAMDNVAAELIASENRLDAVVVRGQLVLVMGSVHDAEESFRSYVAAQAGMLQETLRHSLHISVSIGVSDPYNLYSRTRSAWKECLLALRHKLYSGNGAIVHYRDVKSLQESRNGFPRLLEEELLQSVKLCRPTIAEEQLDAFLQEVFRERRSYQEYQMVIARLLMDLVQLIEAQDLPMDVILRQEPSLFEALAGLRNRQEIGRWLKETILRPLIATLSEQRTLEHRRISDDIIDMIREQADRDLNLELCAERLFYNPKYVSRVFKEETGVSFTEYLARHRLEVAKRMLRETDEKIGDIAAKLKYQNAQNFIRYFKKHEGITPGQYREAEQVT